MSIEGLAQWLREHRWSVALICAVSFGYAFGKDMALRDNARDAAMAKGTD